MEPLLQYVDAVTVPVPDLDAGMAFYCRVLGHELLWRNDDVGQAGLGTPASNTEVVLTTRQGYEPDWKVNSADAAAEILSGQRWASQAGPDRHPDRPAGSGRRPVRQQPRCP